MLGSIWDTASLMTLASSPSLVAHCRRPGMVNAPGWTTVVRVELQRLYRLNPPTSRAGQALRLATSWLGAPWEETAAEQDEIMRLRDRIAAGTGHPDEHLGEAQGIVIAKRTGAVFISEDAGARSEAYAEGVRTISLYGLIGIHVTQDKLTVAAADALATELAAGGRGIANMRLDVASLIAAGHILFRKRSS